MQQSANQINNPNDEISLREIIGKFQSWVSYLWRNWLFLLLGGIVGAGIGLTIALLKKPTYNAQLTFVLEDAKASPLGAYAGLASQFGLDMGSSSSNGIFSGDNIMEFLKSRLMVEKTLLTPVPDNSKSTLAEQYITTYDLREKWSEKPNLADVKFPAAQSRQTFTRQQDSILNVIYQQVVATNLKVEKVDKKLSFISVECSSLNEGFSKVFIERLVDEATTFYVQTKTKRSQHSVDLLQAKADSLEVLLNRKTISVAATQDLNVNPAKSVASVQTELGTRDKLILQTMYGEVIKNLELSKMNLLQETPVIQVIDVPILPLTEEKTSWIKGIIVGGMLAGFLSAVFLLLKKIYRDIMA